MTVTHGGNPGDQPKRWSSPATMTGGIRRSPPSAARAPCPRPLRSGSLARPADRPSIRDDAVPPTSAPQCRRRRSGGHRATPATSGVPAADQQDQRDQEIRRAQSDPLARGHGSSRPFTVSGRRHVILRPTYPVRAASGKGAATRGADQASSTLVPREAGAGRIGATSGAGFDILDEVDSTKERQA